MGPPDLEGGLADAAAAGLWRRLRDVILVAERIDTYAFTPDDDAARAVVDAGEAAGLATDLVLRSLHAASDPAAWAVVAMLADRAEGVALTEIAEALGVPRLAAAEWVNALVQAGLATRALDDDRAFGTPAAEAFVAFVRDVAARLETHAETWAVQRKAPGASSSEAVAPG